MFKNAIVKTPCKGIVNGITTSDLGQPDYDKALEQHHKYIEALKSCGLELTILAADEQFPDSTFVEDTALLTKTCAIITNPGADSRKGEVIQMGKTVTGFYENIDSIQAPGTVEAGDIMMVGSHFYIGLSERTNQEGANQMIAILEKNGMTGSCVELKTVLHLKTGVSYLENNNLLASGEFLDHPDFQQFNILEIDDQEAYASNCIWVNGSVLVPSGFPKTTQKIKNAGYKTIELDMSEFQKIDGGLSCLSLRF